MKPCNFEIYERQADFCQMMANPKRIAIVELLSQKECCVGELADALCSSVSAVSQHLRTMKDKGMVLNRKEAQTVYYHLKNPKLIESCHIMRDVLLEELELQGGITRNHKEKSSITP